MCTTSNALNDNTLVVQITAAAGQIDYSNSPYYSAVVHITAQ